MRAWVGHGRGFSVDIEVNVEPTTMLASTIAAGAAAVLRPMAAQAVKDAYAFLKSVLLRKFGQLELKSIEAKPESAAKQASLTEDLAGTTAADDSEVVDAAKRLIEALSVHAPEIGAVVGVDLIGVRAASLRVGNVASSGAGVRVHSSEFAGDIQVGDVQAGVGRPDPR